MVGLGLSGCTILVVEDDYHLAMEIERALRRAGGTVLGPVGNEADALTFMARETLSCAVVDINLGRGVRFSVADRLQDGDVPFLFVTGYDDLVIPARFADIERLRKPVDAERVVDAVLRMCGA